MPLSHTNHCSEVVRLFYNVCLHLLLRLSVTVLYPGSFPLKHKKEPGSKAYVLSVAV